MAKPATIQALKPVGTFFAATSQNTRQAPFPTAAEVAKPGVLGGYPYVVYFAIYLDNILWLLLESQTAGKFEWARGEVLTGTGPVTYGGYVGEFFGQPRV